MSLPEFLQASCVAVGMGKWGMLTAGRNKRQVHGDAKEMERSREASPEATTAEGARGESQPPSGVLAEKHMRGLPGGLDGRRGNK